MFDRILGTFTFRQIAWIRSYCKTLLGKKIRRNKIFIPIIKGKQLCS
jgi:hypothetical protein